MRVILHRVIYTKKHIIKNICNKAYNVLYDEFNSKIMDLINKKMDIDKLTEEILEITNNSEYGWIDLDSSDADRIRVTLTKAIAVTPCCKSDSELLKNKKKLNFDKWKFSKGIRYVSGHNYKDNDGDLYDSDELEKMYQHYLSL